MARWTWHYLHPRAIRWRHIKRKFPDRPIVTALGKSLKVRIYPHDVIGREIYVHGIFEKAEVRFVTGFLKRGMVFLDLGANCGQYTLLGAQCVGETGKVHSFEPSSRMFAELEFNVTLNGLSDRCVLNNVALSDTEGVARLSKYEAGYEVYGSLGSQNRHPDSVGLEYEDVKTITLDSYVTTHDVGRIDLMKIDIEGAELLALRGGTQLLHSPDAPAIVLEMADVNTDGFGYKAMEIWDFLEECGYHLYRFDRQGAIAGRADRPEDFVQGQNLVAMKS